MKAPVPLGRRIARLARGAGVLLLSLGLAVQPAAAQSVLRDAETEAFLADAARPLVVAAGLPPNAVQLILLKDKEINAFVAGGQAIYIHSGLLTAADSANQVQGVIAHELGHITGGDISRMGQGTRPATVITLLSLLLGAAAMAAGGGMAGAGVMAAGQQAGMGKFLAYSRVVEASADSAGAKYLRGAGITGKGMMQFWDKLRDVEYRYSSSYDPVDPYLQSHPRPQDRAAALQQDLEAAPSWAVPPDPALQARFLRIKGKLVGFVEDPTTTLRLYPDQDTSAAAHYARAYAWHRAAYPDKAVEEVGALVAGAPHDPYYLELKGQILLESGKPLDAIPPLREAVARSGSAPLISALLGHALVASEDPANLAEAGRVLKVSVARDNDNPFAWYQLGIVYAQTGDQARAALASAERYSMTGEPRLALASAEMAMRGIPPGTPDYLRAQDIAMVSRSAADERKRN